MPHMGSGINIRALGTTHEHEGVLESRFFYRAGTGRGGGAALRLSLQLSVESTALVCPHVFFFEKRLKT